jgi:hypothetical protein
MELSVGENVFSARALFFYFVAVDNNEQFFMLCVIFAGSENADKL